MEALLPGSSILAAFLGGMLALAAPCCVTFLLPAYLGGVYRAKAAVLAMTFVFGLGIAVVILPIALGVAALARALNQWHTEVFILGAVLLLAAAYFWERFDLSQSFVFRGRPLELRALGVRYRIHSTNLIAGIIFWALGALILALTFTGQLTQATEAQTSLFNDLQSATDFVLDRAGWLPGAVPGGAVAALFVLLLRSALGRRHGARHESRANGPTGGAGTATLLPRRKEREGDA